MTHRVVVTAGHVDHGKSTLLRALTGMEPDRLAEERRRGLSIELGYVWTELDIGTGPTAVAFVDVPGHERFVTTMLAGTGAAPAALLVVAADDGWSAQTAEHRDALDLLGTPLVAVVVTKAALVEQDRINEVHDQIARELAGSALGPAPVVVTDAVAGNGLEELRTVMARRLPEFASPTDRGRGRLWIDRAFTVTGAGTVVTGTLTGGPLHAGQQLRLPRQNLSCRIRGLESLGVPVDRARPGERVAVNLAGVDHHDLRRGDVLADDGPWQATSRVDVVLHSRRPEDVTRTGAWHLHVGSANVPCRITPLEPPVAGTPPGRWRLAARIDLVSPLPLVTGDRILLRDAGRRAIIAGGLVVDPDVTTRLRGRRSRLARSALLREALDTDRNGSVRHLVQLHGGEVSMTALAAMTGRDTAALAAQGTPGVTTVGTHLVSQGRLRHWTARVRELGDQRLARERIRQVAIDDHASSAVADALADRLVEDGVLTRTEGGYVLTEHADTERMARQARADRLMAALAASPLAPDDLDELAAHHGVDHRQVAALVEQGRIVRCGSVAFASSAVEYAVEVLRALGEDGHAFTAAEAKRAWGTTRRFAIPLLEHLDRTGVTLFDGQLRTLTSSASAPTRPPA